MALAPLAVAPFAVANLHNEVWQDEDWTFSKGLSYLDESGPHKPWAYYSFLQENEVVSLTTVDTKNIFPLPILVVNISCKPSDSSSRRRLLNV